eukprot:4877949-Pleurochrysis_carterae.AAC.1
MTWPSSTTLRAWRAMTSSSSPTTSRTTSLTSALRLPSTGSRPSPLCCYLATRASRVGTGSPSWRSTS